MIQVNSTPLKPIPTSNAYLGPLGLTMPTYYLFNMRGQVKEISFSNFTVIHYFFLYFDLQSDLKSNIPTLLYRCLKNRLHQNW